MIFSLFYFYNFTDDPIFEESMANLLYNESMYGKVEEYAPKITLKKILKHFRGEAFKTKNKELSVRRSRKIYQFLYFDVYKKFERTEIGHRFRKSLGKKHKNWRG